MWGRVTSYWKGSLPMNNIDEFEDNSLSTGNKQTIYNQVNMKMLNLIHVLDGNRLRNVILRRTYTYWNPTLIDDSIFEIKSGKDPDRSEPFNAETTDVNNFAMTSCVGWNTYLSWENFDLKSRRPGENQCESLMNTFNKEPIEQELSIHRMYLTAQIDLNNVNHRGLLQCNSTVTDILSKVKNFTKLMTPGKNKEDKMSKETFKNIFITLAKEYKDISPLNYIAKAAYKIGIKDELNNIYMIKFKTNFIQSDLNFLERGYNKISSSSDNMLDKIYDSIHGGEEGPWDSKIRKLGHISAGALGTALPVLLATGGVLAITTIVVLSLITVGSIAHDTKKRGWAVGALPVLTCMAAFSISYSSKYAKDAKNREETLRSTYQRNARIRQDRSRADQFNQAMGVSQSSAAEQVTPPLQDVPDGYVSSAARAVGNVVNSAVDVDSVARDSVAPTAMNLVNYAGQTASTIGRLPKHIVRILGVEQYFGTVINHINQLPGGMGAIIAYINMGGTLKSIFKIGDNVPEVNRYIADEIIGTDDSAPINIDSNSYNNAEKKALGTNPADTNGLFEKIILQHIRTKCNEQMVTSGILRAVGTGVARVASGGFIKYDPTRLMEYDNDHTMEIKTIEDEQYNKIFGNNKSEKIKKLEMNAREYLKIIDIIPSQIKRAFDEQPSSYDKDLGKKVNDYNKDRMAFLQKMRKEQQKK